MNLPNNKTGRLFIVILLLFLKFITGCKPKKVTHNIFDHLTYIHVNPQKYTNVKITDIIESIRVIPLETSDSSVLGEILGIKKVNNDFFIRGQGKISIFDSEGNFKTIIGKKGKGPGELIAVTNFYVDPENNIIEIYDSRNGRNIMYDLKGNYIKSINHTFNHAYDFIKSKNGGYFFYRGFGVEKFGELIYVENLKSKRHKDLLPFNKTLYKYLHFGDLVNFVTNKYGTYFTRSFNDTIYEVKDNTIEPGFLIDFGDKKLPRKILFSNYSDVRDFFTTCRNTSYAYRVIGFFNIGHDIIFGFNFQKQIWNVIYDKQTQKCIVINYFIDDYFGTNEMIKSGFQSLPKGFDDEYIFVIVDAYIIKEFIMKQKEKLGPEKLKMFIKTLKKNGINEIKETDNPVLLEIKPK